MKYTLKELHKILYMQKYYWAPKKYLDKLIAELERLKQEYRDEAIPLRNCSNTQLSVIGSLIQLIDEMLG